jgi:serine/threonine-protein kinase
VAIKEPLFSEEYPPPVIAEMERRFMSEGYMASRLQHPNVVTVFEAGTYDGRSVIVMELVNGMTLGNLLERGPLGVGVATDVIDQLIDAVSYAHYMGVVHRDIKPDNIFITRDGSVKLADFGIAHLVTTGMEDLRSGAVLGTPGYMSPEQATGGMVDERTDVFSLGVVAYEMLTGQNPLGAHSGLDFQTMVWRTVNQPIPMLVVPTLPPSMAQAIMRALEKDPDKRPQSVKAFKTMLHGMTRVPTTESHSASIEMVMSGGAPPDQRVTAQSGLLYLAIALGGLVMILLLLVIACM